MKLALWKWAVIALAVALFAGCKGGSSVDNGGGSSTTASNNWDSMVWDQGKWQ